MAFACRPRVIVCDEPTTGLDVTTQAKVLETVRDLCRTHHVAVLYVSHDLAVVAELADRVAVMYAGRIVELATRDALFSRHATRTRSASCAPSPTSPEPRRARHPRARAAPAAPQGLLLRPALCVRPRRLPRALPAGHRHGRGHLVRCYHVADAQAARTETGAKAASSSGGRDRAGRQLAERELRWPPDAVRHNLDVRRDECLALVGESGSGKTTLARCIVGLHRDFTGRSAARRRLPPSARKRSAGAPAPAIRLSEPVRIAEPAALDRRDDRPPAALFFPLGRRKPPRASANASSASRSRPTRAPAFPISFRAASGSASRSRGRSRPSPRCSSATRSPPR